MNDKHDLDLVISGHFPIIVLQTHEEIRALALLKSIALEKNRPLLMWSVTDGLRKEKSTVSGSDVNWEEVTYDGQPGIHKNQRQTLKRYSLSYLRIIGLPLWFYWIFIPI
jgi:hypothetical protein